MLQDAHRSYDQTHTHYRAIFTTALLLATSVVLISCNGQRATRRVTQPYLADTTTNPSETPDNSTTTQESPQTKNESTDKPDLTASNDLVDDFSAALDDYLNDPNAAKSKTTSQQINKNENTPANSPTSITNQTKPIVTADPNPPIVQWETPSQQPNASSATPADRQENIGSAKDPLRKSVTTMNEVTPVKANPSNTNHESANQSSEQTTSQKPNPTSADTIKSFSRDELLVLLSAKLRREAAYSSVPLREYLLDAATLMLDPSRRISTSDMYDLNTRERKLLDSMQGFFIEIGKQLETTRDPETIIDAVNKLARGLGSDDRIEIPNFKLCTAVQSYGNYDEIKSTSFIRGKPHEVITYIEVSNFKPLTVDGNRYKTVLTQESELFTDSDGTLVFRQPAVTADDYCRNIRHDFFLVRHLTLPANLSVGSYYLKVRVKDETTQQQAEAIIPITIVAS